MKSAWEVARSMALWAMSWLHFLIAVPILIALAVVLDPRKHDWLQRGLCTRIAFFSGAKVVVKMAPGFDSERTSFFMVNHVNLFDPFILYCAIPQLVRGWELESHFRIPIYGWLMKRFGNVPVPNGRSPKELKKLWRLTQEAITSGTSLIVFPEAKRTRDGNLNSFEDGGFRLAQQLGVPIVPVTLDGWNEEGRCAGIEGAGEGSDCGAVASRRGKKRVRIYLVFSGSKTSKPKWSAASFNCRSEQTKTSEFFGFWPKRLPSFIESCNHSADAK